MWRSIGSIASPDNKSTKSRQQVIYEPFSYSSKLRLNNSQISISQSQNHALQTVKKRNNDEISRLKNKSQKQLQYLSSQNRTSSIKQFNQFETKKSSSKERGKDVNISGLSLERSLKNDQKDIEIKKLISQKNKKLQEVAILKTEQLRLKKNVQTQLAQFSKMLKEIEVKMTTLEGERKEKQKEQTNIKKQQNQVKISQYLNPQVLNKLRLESTKFNERIAQIENKKKELRNNFNNKKI